MGEIAVEHTLVTKENSDLFMNFLLSAWQIPIIMQA